MHCTLYACMYMYMYMHKVYNAYTVYMYVVPQEAAE